MDINESKICEQTPGIFWLMSDSLSSLWNKTCTGEISPWKDTHELCTRLWQGARRCQFHSWPCLRLFSYLDQFIPHVSALGSKMGVMMPIATDQAGASIHYCLKHAPVEGALGIWKVIFMSSLDRGEQGSSQAARFLSKPFQSSWSSSWHEQSVDYKSHSSESPPPDQKKLMMKCRSRLD